MLILLIVLAVFENFYEQYEVKDNENLYDEKENIKF